MQTNKTRIPQWLLPYLQAHSLSQVLFSLCIKVTRVRQTSRAFPQILMPCRSKKHKPIFSFAGLVTCGSGYGELVFCNSDTWPTFFISFQAFELLPSFLLLLSLLFPMSRTTLRIKHRSKVPQPSPSLGISSWWDTSTRKEPDVLSLLLLLRERWSDHSSLMSFQHRPWQWPVSYTLRASHPPSR